MLLSNSPGELLPTSKPFSTAERGRPLLTKRYSRILFAGIFSLTALLCFMKTQPPIPTEYVDLVPKIAVQEPQEPALPPLYEQYHEYERHLPQHDPSLPASEGDAAKFLFISNHYWGVGWGNVLQEMFMNAHLAELTNRAFVFDNYTWDRAEASYSQFNGNVIPSRVPVSTMLSGPLIGGSFGPGSNLPRAVSREYFKEMCPHPTVLRIDEANYWEEGSDPVQYLQDWVQKINAVDDRCVEIAQDSEQIFSFWLFGRTQVLKLWPSLSRSLLVKRFAYSPLILSAYSVNKRIFEPTTPSSSGIFSNLPSLSSLLPSFFLPRTDPVIPGSYEKPLDGLLALHIRRGDFEDHCLHLGKWSSLYNGFNSFPELPDHFDPVAEFGAGNEPADEVRRVQGYLGHCFPSIPQIVKRVNGVRRDANAAAAATARANSVFGWGKVKELKKIYIMTNGKREWLDELKAALQEGAVADGAAPWEMISTSRDLEMTWEQKYVSQTLDMYVAERAQTFVGNGFSSLTSNIVMLRMANKVLPLNTRFW